MQDCYLLFNVRSIYDLNTSKYMEIYKFLFIEKKIIFSNYHFVFAYTITIPCFEHNFKIMFTDIK